MLPEIARRAIEAYSEPGDLVVDPMCGIGTTLVEAIHAGRHAVGVELEDRWATLAEGNAALAREQGADGRARVIEGDARELPHLLAVGASDLLRPPRRRNVVRLPSGAVDLVLTSPPYGCDLIEPYKTARPAEAVRAARNYGGGARNVGHARGAAYLRAMADVYRAAAAVLKPGGFLVTVTKEMRPTGALRDLGGETIALCERAGLVYWEHVIALLATIRGGELVPRPSFWQRLQLRRSLAQGEFRQLVCHEDVRVFRKPAHR
jgi:modification methylase